MSFGFVLVRVRVREHGLKLHAIGLRCLEENSKVALGAWISRGELELELIQTQMAQKPMLRAEVGMRVRCANKASAE